jgi:hypothetical protein
MNLFNYSGRYAVTALAVAIFLGGCASQHVADVQALPREQISFAATAKYPTTEQTSDKVQAVALDAPGDQNVTVYNLTNDPIPPATLWVNGTFVRQIDGITAKGHLTVAYGNLIQAGPSTADLKQSGQAVNKVELQTLDGLFKVQGPGMK